MGGRVQGSGRATASPCWDLAGCGQCCGWGWETPPGLGQHWVRGWCCPDSRLFRQGRGRDLLRCGVACTNSLLFPPRRPWLPAGNGECPPPRSPPRLRHTSRGSALLGLNWECCGPLNWSQSLCTAGWCFATLASLGAGLSPPGVGGLSRVFHSHWEPRGAREGDTPGSAGSGNCLSFPQSLVQSRKAGITSALASSTLNNEELVGAGAGWDVGWSQQEG